MSNLPAKEENKIIASIKEFRKQYIIGLLVAMTVGLSLWLVTKLVDRLELQPIGIGLDPNESGLANVRGFFEQQIRPILREVCSRPTWQTWIAEAFLDQSCTHLVFDPYHLERMDTRRVPFNEVAEPFELLLLFVEHHSGCLSMRRDGDRLIIEEPENSQIIRERGRLICP